MHNPIVRVWERTNGRFEHDGSDRIVMRSDGSIWWADAKPIDGCDIVDVLAAVERGNWYEIPVRSVRRAGA